LEARAFSIAWERKKGRNKEILGCSKKETLSINHEELDSSTGRGGIQIPNGGEANSSSP
jgi:hypothetical protein